MIRAKNVDRGCALHPSARGYFIHVPAANNACFVAGIAETALTPGQILTIVVGAAGAGLAGFVNGTPCAVMVTVTGGTGATGTVLRITGFNQFGSQVTEDITIAGATGATVHTNNAFKQILRIMVVSTAATGTGNISVGIGNVVGQKLALPFRTISNVIPGTTLASFQRTDLEFIGLTHATTPTGVFIETAPGAVNTQYSTIQFPATIPAGTYWCITRQVKKGFGGGDN